MILSLKQYEQFQEYINSLYEEKPDLAYQAILEFLQEVFDCYQTSAASREEHKKIEDSQSNDWDNYQKIKFKIKLLTELNKNPIKLAAAFQQAYKNKLPKIMVRAPKSSNDLGDSDIGVDLNEFAYAISCKFTFGLCERFLKLHEKVKKDLEERKASVNDSFLQTANTAKEEVMKGNIHGFIEQTLMFVQRAEAEATEARMQKLNLEEKLKGEEGENSEEEGKENDRLLGLFTDHAKVREDLAIGYRLTVNQAIDILSNNNEYLKNKESGAANNKEEEKEHKDKEKEHKDKEKEHKDKEKKSESEAKISQIDIANRDLVATVNNAFIKHIDHEFKKFTIQTKDESVDFDKDNIADNAYIANVYKYCYTYYHNRSNDIDKRQIAGSILNDIFGYYTPNAADPYLVNPSFTLNPHALKDDLQYQELLKVMSIDLDVKIKPFIERTKNHIQHYIDNRGGFFNTIRDTFVNLTVSNPHSKERRRQHAGFLTGAFQQFSMDATAKGISDLGTLIHSCNKSIYGDYGDASEKEKSYKKDKKAIRTPYLVNNRSSNFKKAVVACINEPNAIRGFVNNNYRKIECMLGSGSGITKHEFYFELNLSRNEEIRQQAKEKYKDKVNSWWGKTVGVLSFSSGATKRMRKEELKVLLKTLKTCRTEDGYVAFLYKALHLLANSTSKSSDNHVYDNLYADTILDICRKVVATHITTDDQFKLNYSIEQLQLVVKILQALKLTNDPSFIKLEKMIEAKKLEEMKRPSETSIGRELEEKIIDGQKGDIEYQNEKRKQAKINLFKTMLLSKLEGNLLADIVVSTGRFVLKDKDIGLIGQGLSLVLANAQLPGAAAMAAVLKAGGHMLDDKMQIDQGKQTSELVTDYKGAFSLYWNEIVLVAVNKLVELFADELGRIKDSEDVTRFAELCFKRMYDAISHPAKKITNDIGLIDYLVASVFVVNKNLGWTPGRKDHYRRDGDTSWFPKTTFQGFLDNVAFRCEPSPSENDQGMSTNDIYVTLRSLAVKDRKSKLGKYGICSGNVEPILATALGRAIVNTDTKLLDTSDVSNQLGSEIDVVCGQRKDTPVKQEELIGGFRQRPI